MVVLSDGRIPPRAHLVPQPASVGDSYSSLYHRDPVLPFRESAELAVLQVGVVSAKLHQSVSEGHPKCPDSGSMVEVVEVVVHPLVLLYHLSPYDLYLIDCSK